jgi:ankyrin repeat protein
MISSIKKLMDSKDYEGLREALSHDPHLANEGLPYDEVNTATAPPLHRICDGVFSKKFTDAEAVEIARIFLEYGADINGGTLTEKQDSPLVAAASLNADQVAILYIENGADIHHAGCHGGTALHWAAWCGRDKVVERLIREGAAINKTCIDFKATPLFCAVHGWRNGDKNDTHNYIECIKLLREAGADITIPNKNGNTVFDLLDEEDREMKAALS